MTDLMARPVVPVASEEDAEETYATISTYLGPDAAPVLIHVIEKAGGGIDKAGVEQREEVAEAAFAVFRRLAAEDGVSVETSIRYGTDIADAIEDAAREYDATAIAFVPRGGGRIVEFLSGNVRSKLTNDNEFPAVVLPSPQAGDGTTD
ncbi:universal stress protein [Halorubrum sp. JWXQ-INN 858]|uniref:universal stress protein n=1 Tax=Halorubrum sp. JWXQ-INN 858 TaxID=2690782 RepID=UPI0013581441|nr:universal stress protein [Halorubrum sp. JWXQ-INN 858]MWV64739.1 universal stress protein [Halorubrum sp. JWXQ-INN 858]